LVIVGHGPSLKGAKLGRKIDEQVVVRLKNCSDLLKDREDYGSRTDVMCSSTEVTHHLPKVQAKEYWCYPKKGFYDEKLIQKLDRQVTGKVIVPLRESTVWNQVFRDMGGKHPCVSTGMAAIIFALELTKPKTLYLAGFDKVLNPKTEGYISTVPTPFNAGGSKDTGHDWQKENELLKFLAHHFNCEITDLANGHVV
jgi:hypothetical protein